MERHCRSTLGGHAQSVLEGHFFGYHYSDGRVVLAGGLSASERTTHFLELHEAQPTELRALSIGRSGRIIRS